MTVWEIIEHNSPNIHRGES